MRYINYLFLVALFLNACQVSNLTDETSNSFTAIATQGDHTDKVVISWIQAEFYANYTVLKSTVKDGYYYPIKEFFNGKQMEDIDIEEGILYYYKVQGYNGIGTPMFVTESAEGFAGASGGFSPPKDIVIIPASSTKEIKLCWERVKDAVEYQILRSTDDDFFEPITNTFMLHYKDRNVQKGQKYYYKITSLDKDGIPSPNRSKTIVGELFGANLELRSPAGEYTDQIKLIWKSYSFANYYVISRSKDPNGGMGSIIKEIKISDPIKQGSNDLEYIDKNVETGELYYYYITYKNDTASSQTDSIRSYLKTDSAPTQPQNFQVSQGVHPKDVELSWDPVEGASSYEIARSISSNGPWNTLGSTDKTIYSDKNIPDDSYTYFYTVTGLNPSLGTTSTPKEGWANKAPVGISASSNFGDRVRLSWNKVPGALLYTISFSESEDGAYRSAGESSVNNFDHKHSIGTKLSQDLWYKVAVITGSGQSAPSFGVKGSIKKISAPQNVQVLGNRTPTKSMIITWGTVSGARKYYIYQATLAHKNASTDRLQSSHFEKIGESENAAFSLSFSTYPIRRNVYFVRAVDAGGAEGVETKTEIVWRLPVDVTDFAKDVDYSIVQAQTQVPNFGAMGSGGKIFGRAGGSYDYYAGASGSKNNWDNYTSFEATLSGNQSVGVDIGNLSATLNGDLNVTGLYSGTVTYNNLNAKQGGYVFSGSMTVKYNGQNVTWSHTEAAAHLSSVVLLGSESPPRPPSFEPGHG